MLPSTYTIPHIFAVLPRGKRDKLIIAQGGAKSTKKHGISPAGSVGQVLNGAKLAKKHGFSPAGCVGQVLGGAKSDKSIELAPRGKRDKLIVIQSGASGTTASPNIEPRQNNRFIKRFVVEFSLYVYVQMHEHFE